jgi:cation transport ATPase
MIKNTKQVSEELSITGKMLQQLQQFAQKGFKEVSLKKLRGGFFLVIGYLLSPLCWWNDLVFNLPVSYCFGYICSWFSPNLLLPGLIVGYWLSNIVGILLMQAGAVEVFQQSKERNLKKELLMGLATSTVYTLAIVALIQFKILDAPFLFSGS